MNGIWIPGEPAVFAGAGETAYKKMVQSLLEETNIIMQPEWLDFEFKYVADRIYRKDIDNTITPILDGMRDAGYVQTGYKYLGTITARKRIAKTETEVGVLVSSCCGKKT